MADVLHFDVDEALDAMLRVFWQQGFKATSTKQLAASASLSEGSLFNTFGNKQAIYVRALKRYEVMLESMDTIITTDPSPLSGIRMYWESIANYAADPSHAAGCFFTNACIERSDDPEVEQLIRNYHKRSESLFKKALDRAVAIGELNAKADRKAMSQFLLHSTQGIRVLSRLNPAKSKMKNIVDLTMAAIDSYRIC